MEARGYRQTFNDTLGDWRWRLNNLYWITDKEGRRTKFQMNWAQETLFNEMHHLNVILKARQLGFTTFIQVFMLDACVFKPNIRAGTIAHRLEDAQAIFRDKIKFPYDNLPEAIRAAVPIVKDSVTELLLANNSSIRVSTSHRSGTLNYLHVSEYGWTVRNTPTRRERYGQVRSTRSSRNRSRSSSPPQKARRVTSTTFVSRRSRSRGWARRSRHSTLSFTSFPGGRMPNTNSTRLQL